MGRHFALSLILIFLLFFLPWLWGEPTRAVQEEPPAGDTEPDGEEEPPEAPPEEPSAAASIDKNRKLNILAGGQLRQTDMESYLMGVVRAEMPAAFELEALKAQAVAARTYTLHKMQNGGSANHPEADACDDITCCQAYLSQADAAAGWGPAAAVYEAKIRQAVAETDGQCVLYQGEPVLAAFHSSSAGMTQDAANVWSGSVPYLQSVESPEDETTVPNYHSSASFSINIWGADHHGHVARLQEALPEADLSGTPSNWFTNIQQQSNGTVTSLSVGGVSLTGNRLRTILELRSACFTMAFQEDTVTFSVTGYGGHEPVWGQRPGGGRHGLQGNPHLVLQRRRGGHLDGIASMAAVKILNFCNNFRWFS